MYLLSQVYSVNRAGQYRAGADRARHRAAPHRDFGLGAVWQNWRGQKILAKINFEKKSFDLKLEVYVAKSNLKINQNQHEIKIYVYI